MRWGTAIAVYFVIWWVVLFAVLPLKVRTQGEAGEVVAGTPASAPARPHLLLKVALTSVLAAIVFAALWMLVNSGLTLDDVPFLPKFGRST